MLHVVDIHDVVGLARYILSNIYIKPQPEIGVSKRLPSYTLSNIYIKPQLGIL